MKRTKYDMQRFDLYIPKVAAAIIEKGAERINIPPRTYGRMLLLEKVKEIAGIAPDQSLPTEIDAIPRQHTQQKDGCNDTIS